MDYRLQVYSLPAALEDAWTAALWRAGILGCEVKGAESGSAEAEPGRIWVEAYLPEDRRASDDGAPLDGLDWDRWQEQGVRFERAAAIADRDWLAEYRATSQPFEVGRHFVVDPGEPAADDEPSDPSGGGSSTRSAAGGRRVLRVPAQNAFGTGSHESTRLAIEWLEELELRGRRLLDVGCGSGILAFAAEHLGIGSVHAYDLDAPSVILARQNGRRNGCAPTLWAGTRASLRSRSSAGSRAGVSFDLLTVNVLPERILDDYPHLLGLLRAGGEVISSGNLLSRREELLDRFVAMGLRLSGEKQAGEWTSFLLQKT